MEGIVSIATDWPQSMLDKQRGGGGEASIFFHEHFPHSSDCNFSCRYVRNLRIYSQAGPGDCPHIHGQWLGL